MLKPKQRVPDLTVKTVGGPEWTLSGQSPENFTFLFFYRGYHCPICRKYLGSIDRKFDDLSSMGIYAVAISSDSEERATRSKDEWKVQHLPIGYGLSIDQARHWGLYISRAIKADEPEIFSEPGLFIVRPNLELYAASLQTMPFTRPSIEELIGGFSYIIQNDYPGRGEA
ncbi:AhpC/TSA family protein [Bremerella cremea]|uniref:Alkyl hydroperoxide reductase n=1 Tax=Blastopirellula marina TaxID=124 RepID=A0A2S8FD17_9BACT|nr:MULTISPECIES: peroxiredoxin-like family protein [Pirellulaceae]PQO29834.1 alkyl hydroperoxide reductase [Blastopirellula marina]RCS43136.1 AhpC/TSA family protein [Bremerella cremea]